MLSTRSPLTAALFNGFSKRGLRLFLRGPELAALEPLHLRIGVPLLQSTQRGQKVLAFGGAERRWKASCEDRPVRKAWRHWLLLSESLEFFDKRRPLDMQQFSGAIPVSARAIK